MNVSKKHWCGAFLLWGAVSLPVLSQGPLDPSGAPVPTMKTLDQVEPRIPLSDAPVAITNAGSYYLTRALTNFVVIAASDVTLDLMGYAIDSPFGNAIAIGSAETNLVIRNGIVRASNGSGIGFNLSSEGANGLIEDLTVGPVSQHGIHVNDGFLVRNCRVSGAGDTGIRVEGNSVVEDNVVTRCSIGLLGKGQGATFAGNRVLGNGKNYVFAKGDHLNLLLSEIPVDLAWPCSVTLAGSLSAAGAGTTGIVVSADNVTIDLAGHSLNGSFQLSPQQERGIYQLSGVSGLTIRNGRISGWRGNNSGGIYARGAQILIEGIQAVSNYWGINTSPARSGVIIRDSQAEHCNLEGILARDGVIERCSANYNARGIRMAGGVVTAATANYNVFYGITAYDAVVQGCTVMSNDNDGITASASRVTDCHANENGAFGFKLQGGSTIRDSLASGNGDAGFAVVLSSTSRVERCHALGNGVGFEAEAANSIFIGNTASGNITNWNLAAGNVALVIDAVTAGAIVGDSGGVSPGTDNPFANFSY